MDVSTSTELKLLVVAVVIGLAQLVWSAVAGSGGARDLPWLVGPRDDPRPVSGVAARVDRAFQNFLQTFPLYAAALLASLLAGKRGDLTLWGSYAYVGGRLLFPFLYAAGIPWLRTLVWTVSMIGIVMIVVAFFK